MINIVFFLEEPSAREMLKGLLPRLLPAGVTAQYVVFQGKQDLEKRLPLRLRSWLDPNAKFVVMRDQDNGDCAQIEKNLINKCKSAGKPDALVRIACRELESFFLGDLKAVANSIGPYKIINLQEKSKYRDPDRLANPSEELKKIAPKYQKVAGSRDIGPLLDISSNKSKSFISLIAGLKLLIKDDRLG